MKEKINIKTLINFSKGKYSYNNYLKVKEWFCNFHENKELKEQLFVQWNELNNQSRNRDHSLNHLFEKIQFNIWREKRKETKKIRIWNYYRRIAAILLIPVLVFSIWYYYFTSANEPVTLAQQTFQSWVEINAPDGARVEFFLPDSTRGWLNSGSKLKYPTVFSKKRTVELTGEAWFDVKHHAASEFVVSVCDMDVKVLGTQFNVSAYSGDDFTNVTLEEGKVEINGKTGVFNQVLTPNEKISFNKEVKAVTLSKVDATRFSAWKEGYLVIDNEPLGDVINRLERWYNVDINIQDETLKKYRFKATFKDEPLEEVLKLMAKTTPIIYTIEKRTADNKGIYKQKKVTMKLKQ
jgi:ferric-dicitrate binding protein FerR (iron transport regulator)